MSAVRRVALLAGCAATLGCEPPARTYLPPAARGDVYAVARYAGTSNEPRPTRVSVVWGTFSRSASFPRTGGAGLVLHLRHVRADRVTMTLRTSGRVVFGPVQGPPPPEWGSPAYQRVSW